MENNSTLGMVLLACNRKTELLRLVGAYFQEDEEEKFDKKFAIFLFYLFVVVDIWIDKYQLKVFGKL